MEKAPLLPVEFTLPLVVIIRRDGRNSTCGDSGCREVHNFRKVTLQHIVPFLETTPAAKTT